MGNVDRRFREEAVKLRSYPVLHSSPQILGCIVILFRVRNRSAAGHRHLQLAF